MSHSGKTDGVVPTRGAAPEAVDQSGPTASRLADRAAEATRALSDLLRACVNGQSTDYGALVAAATRVGQLTAHADAAAAELRARAGVLAAAERLVASAGAPAAKSIDPSGALRGEVRALSVICRQLIDSSVTRRDGKAPGADAAGVQATATSSAAAEEEVRELQFVEQLVACGPAGVGHLAFLAGRGYLKHPQALLAASEACGPPHAAGAAGGPSQDRT